MKEQKNVFQNHSYCNYAKECSTLRGGTLSFLRDFSDRSAPSGEEAEKRKQTHVVVLRCAVRMLFEFLEQCQ